MNLEIVINIFVVLHLIGLSSLLGGFLTQMKELKNGGKITPAIFHGAWTLFITGFVLTGLVYMNGEEANSLIVGAKSVVITAIFFIAYAYAKKSPLPKWVLPLIAVLTITNVCLAVFVGAVIEG